MKRIHIIIRGHVQGVFFRIETRNIARQLNLKGWVRNKDFDQVEILAEGDDANINHLIEFAKKGTDASNIYDVKIQTEEYLGDLMPFQIRY